MDDFFDDSFDAFDLQRAIERLAKEVNSLEQTIGSLSIPNAIDLTVPDSLSAALEELTSVIVDLQDEIAGLGGGRAATPGTAPVADEVLPESAILDDSQPASGGGFDLDAILGSELGKLLQSKLGVKLGNLGDLGSLLQGLMGGGKAAAPTSTEAALALKSGGGVAVGSGGAAGGVAALGGPVAIALLVDQVAGRLIRQQGEQIRGAIQGAVGAYRSAISGDVEGLARGGTEKVAGFLENTGIGGKVLAEQLRTTTELIFAFKELYDATIDAAEAQEQHNFRLAESSASMAAVQAQVDVRETFREMETGDRTAGTAGDLSDSLQDLADQTKEVRILIDNIKNTVLARLVDVANAALQPIVAMAKVVEAAGEHPVIKAILDRLKSEQGEEKLHTFGQLLDNVRRAEADARQRDLEWFRRADFGRQKRDEMDS